MQPYLYKIWAFIKRSLQLFTAMCLVQPSQANGYSNLTLLFADPETTVLCELSINGILTLMAERSFPGIPGRATEYRDVFEWRAFSKIFTDWDTMHSTTHCTIYWDPSHLLQNLSWTSDLKKGLVFFFFTPPT